MTRLTFGILLWSVVHFFPAVSVNLRKDLIKHIGEYPYKGVFALLLMLSLYLIVSGWGTTAPGEIYYTVPTWGSQAARLLVLAGFILFFAPYPPNNFKRLLRHPQLIGTICWGAGHLLAVGSLRSTILFGGLTGWAIIQIILINRRDGDWVRPETVTPMRDLSLVLFGVLVYAVVLFTHDVIFGGNPLT
jgi:uncharacterized membrane protein